MHPTTTPPQQHNPRRARDFFGDAMVWILTAALFWPTAHWLVARTLASGQIQHAFIVLAFALFVLARDRGLGPVWRIGRLAYGHLVSAYLLMAVALLTHRPIFVLLAFCLLAAAVLFYIFGDGIRRLAWALIGTFAAFVGLIVIGPTLDWPLRAAAGRMAAWMLGVIGQNTGLSLMLQGEPKLILSVNDHIFEVASECNGFGLIGGSLLLALLLVIFRKIRWFDKLLALGVAALTGFILNAVRIVFICLLAPHVGDHYHLMHEAVGITLFGAGLVLVWWLITGLPERKIHPQIKPDKRGEALPL